MSEISKLKQRLSNISKNAVEYRMTVQEAKALVEEFDELERQSQQKPVAVQAEDPPRVIIQIMDGGSF